MTEDEMVLQINIKFGLQAKRAYVILLMSASGKCGRFPKSSPCSSQLEKVRAQQQRPNAAKTVLKNKESERQLVEWEKIFENTYLIRVSYPEYIENS